MLQPDLVCISLSEYPKSVIFFSLCIFGISTGIYIFTVRNSGFTRAKLNDEILSVTFLNNNVLINFARDAQM